MPIASVVLDALRVYWFFYLYCADWLLTHVL